MHTRREFAKLALAGLTFPRIAAAAVDSTIRGVRLGVQTYSFRDLPRAEGADYLTRGACKGIRPKKGTGPVKRIDSVRILSREPRPSTACFIR